MKTPKYVSSSADRLRAILLITSSMVPLIGLSSVAVAQANPTVSQTGSQDDSVPQEVVVTATRRAESQLNVPLDVSAYNQATLDTKGVRDIEGLTQMTPGVTFEPGWGGSSNISIRGIYSSVGAATTGIYIDDTPIQSRNIGAGATSTNAYPAIFDLDHAEVLRGPQGTLFGAGSEGGTIRFITPQPSLTTFSSYDRSELAFTDGGGPSEEFGAAAGGPIVQDKVGFRVSAYFRDDGGWVDRAPYPSDTVVDKNANSKTTIALRAALKFAITDRLTITPTILYERANVNDTSQIWANSSAPQDGSFINGQSLRQPDLDQYYLANVTAEYDFGAAALISDTSYFDRNNPQTLDYTNYVGELLGADAFLGSKLGVLSPDTADNKQEIFTQEVRLQSTGSENSRLTWTIGLFYQDAKESASETINTPQLDTLSNALYGVPAIDAFGIGNLPGNISYYGHDTSDDTQIAAFGQLHYRFTHQLAATLGMRAADTKFKFTNEQGGPLNDGMSGGAGGESEVPVTPKVSLEYKPFSQWLLYTTAAKGFRDGGGNSPVPSTVCAKDLGELGLSSVPTTYGSDSLWSYEGGAKGRLFNNRLQIEGSVFYIDWSNIQSTVPLNDCGFQYTSNLGSAVSKGFDLDTTFIVFPGLSVAVALGYTNAEYSKTINGALTSSGAQGAIVAGGEPLPTVPWHVTLAADYSAPVPFMRKYKYYIHGEYDSNSGYNVGSADTLSYDPRDHSIPSNSTLNARIGVKLGGFDLSVFGNNLLNSHANVEILHDTVASNLFRYVTLRPLTVGITAGYRY